MSYTAAERLARRDPHLPRWLGRTGLWQAILAAAGIAILVVNVIGYRHATADLAEYRAAIRHICVDDEESGCLYWEQVKVDRVVIETPRRGPNLYELFVVWDDGPSEIDFTSDEPLLHRISHGSLIWAGYPPYGYVTAVSSDAVWPPNAQAATQTWNSPVYEPWMAMSWLIAGGTMALFFAWRAVLVRTGRDGPTGQNRLRWMAGALVAVSVIMALVNSESPSTFDGSELAAYGVVAGALVLAQGLYMLVVGRPVDTWLPRRVAAPAGPPSGQVMARRKSQRTGATSPRRRPSTPGNPPARRSVTGGSGALPPAGGLGPLRLRWLVARAPVGSGDHPPLATVEAPPVLAAAVIRAAEHVGVAAPDRVLIDCRPIVEVHVARDPSHRIDLHIGAPLALTLSERSLRAVAAHALAVLREPRPWLASALVDARRTVHESHEYELLNGWPGKPVVAFLADTEAFADDIEQRADAAAARTTPPAGSALTALVRAGMLARHFTAFAEAFVPKEEEDDPPVFPAALYTGWLSTLERAAPVWLRNRAHDPEEIASDIAAHPGLAAARGKHLLENASNGLGRHGALASLSAADELELSRSYVSEEAELDPAELTPAEWSSFDADEVYGDALWSPGPAVSALLGHPASPAEILAMFESDGGQKLVAAVVQEARRSLDDLPDEALREYLSDRMSATPGEVLVGLVVDTLHERGYRRCDVLHPGLMTGPAGETVDVYAVVSSALGADPGMRRLGALLSGDA